MLLRRTVDIGISEGDEFYRPLAIDIIGGTITSTLMTLAEAILALLLLRWGYRAVRALVVWGKQAGNVR